MHTIACTERDDKIGDGDDKLSSSEWQLKNGHRLV